MILIEAERISKEYPGVKALDNVSISLEPGEVHAIVGENGAGKSTFLNILSGIIPYGSFEGRIRVLNKEVRFHTSKEAELGGISIIHQEPALVEEFTAAENIFLGSEFSKGGVIWGTEMIYKTRELLKQYDFKINAEEKTANLGMGEQQMVEIAKALRKESMVLILDEPTSALTETEVNQLFAIIRSLKEKGKGILYISHRLNEVFEISDRITILRDGKYIGTKLTKEWSREDLIKGMVGRELKDYFPYQLQGKGDKVLEVKELTVCKTESPFRKILLDISLNVHAGEIVGISGLMGAGRTELLNTIFGNPPGIVEKGEIFMMDKELKKHSPYDAIANKIGLIPEDRKVKGLVLDATIKENISMAHLEKFSSFSLVNNIKEEIACRDTATDVGIKTNILERLVKTLSGGNQQKVSVGKWLIESPRLLLLDEPTRGIDVMAKFEIYQLLNRLKKKGVGILMASGELLELLGICDRIIIMKQGRINGELLRSEATQEKLMELAV
jgi:D-xylose transport system ATP-binding protein